MKIIEDAPTIEPDSDTISRQAVIELIQGSICDLEYSDENRELCNKVRALPPSPSRQKGGWINNHTTCSQCGWQMIDDVIQSPNMVWFNFCPNCGADMRT